jgi:Carboxypeptidase regulatory-like domain
MPLRASVWFVTALMAAWLLPVDAQQPPPGQQQQQGGQRGRGMQRPQREANRPVPTGTASIAGRVLAADTGRPIKRARVIVVGGGRPFSAITDDQGRFRVTGLPAATYNITATKSGFVDSAYGQRRALRAGTPVQLADGQQLANVDMKLPRGGVITGRIADEDGESLARAVVSVMRYQYVRGERQLMPAGFDQTDDRGQYRIFGLPPGDYHVTATAGGMVEQIMRSVLETPPPTGEPGENVGYAPTYYPGVINPTEATSLKVATGQETAGIDFQVQLVPLGTVRGVVSGANAIVMLVPEGGTLGGGGRGGGGRGGGGRGALAEVASGLLRGNQTLRATTQPDGSFSIRNVPPGSYTIVARADMGSGAPKTAVQPLLVTGDEVQVALTPVPGVALSGAITLEAAGTALPRGFDGFRVNPSPMGAAAVGGRGGRGDTPNERGEFTITDMMPGRYVLRATGPRGWTMKSIYIEGREATDEAIEVKGDSISGVNVIFTDKISSVTGTVRNAKGTPAANITVVLFAQDEKLWYPQSRYIDAARTTADGLYRIAALPPGSYLAVAVEDVEQGEWFDPAFLEQIRNSGVRLTLGEGEQKTQDLKAPA